MYSRFEKLMVVFIILQIISISISAVSIISKLSGRM